MVSYCRKFFFSWPVTGSEMKLQCISAMSAWQNDIASLLNGTVSIMMQMLFYMYFIQDGTEITAPLICEFESYTYWHLIPLFSQRKKQYFYCFKKAMCAVNY